MSSKIWVFNGKKIVPLSAALLLLVVVSLLISQSPLEVDAAEFNDVQSITAKKTTGAFQGVLSSGVAVNDGDVINIKAINATAPNLTTDKVFITILVNDSTGTPRFSVDWSLPFSGTGDVFEGNITMNRMLSSSYTVNGAELSIKAVEGDDISLRKQTTTNEPFFFFTVDVNGPLISPVEPGSSFVRYKGEAYADPGSKLNFTFSDSDPDTTLQWMLDNNKIEYGWIGGSYGTYNGTAVDVPTGSGSRIIWVNATDRYGHHTNWSEVYNLAPFLTSGTPINKTVTPFSSQKVFIGDITVTTGGAISFLGSEIIFLSGNDGFDIVSEGSISIKDSTITSTGDLFTISSALGSTLSINDTVIEAPAAVPASSNILELGSGTLDNVTVHNLTNKILISGGGVSIMNSNIMMGGTGAIEVNNNHTWDKSMITIKDTVINGTADIPIRVVNTSIWRPFDVDEYYYSDIGSVGTTFHWNTTNLINPYISIPHFIDSRSSLDSFNVEYNNSGTWTSYTDYPVSDTIYEEWVNSEDARFDLSFLPEGEVEVRVNWSSGSGGDSCIYLGSPKAGADGMMEIELGKGGFDGNMVGWTHNKVSGTMLLLDNISIENAGSSFILVESSGLVKMTGLHLGGETVDFNPSTLVYNVNSSIEITDVDLVCNNNTWSGYYQLFNAGNDFGTTLISGSNITQRDNTSSPYGMFIDGGWAHISDLMISGKDTGVYANDAFVSLSDVEIEAETTGYLSYLPDSYPTDPILILDQVKMDHDWEETGIGFKGSPDDYDLDLRITRYSLTSNYHNYDPMRSDGLGAIVLDITGTSAPTAYLQGNITDSPEHGLSVPNWPSSGIIEVNANSKIQNIALDGVYLGDHVNIILNAISIRNCDGYGVRAGDNTNLTIEKISGIDPKYDVNGMGGMFIGNSSKLSLENLLIEDVTGWAISIGKDATLNLTDVDINRCYGGLEIGEGSSADLNELFINSSSTERGLYAKETDINMEKSTISGNSQDGIFMDGGSLQIRYTDIFNNVGTGLRLWNVQLEEILDCKINGNTGDGLFIHIKSDSILDPDGYYAFLDTIEIMDNNGVGITATLDPIGVTRTVEIEMTNILIGNNRGGEIITPNECHIQWNAESNPTGHPDGREVLGSDMINGRVRANMDITVMGEFTARIKNINITLLGDGRDILIKEYADLYLENCYIRPDRTSYHFSMTGEKDSVVDIKGGFLGQLYRLEMENGGSFSMDGTLVKNSDGPISLKDTTFDFVDSEFSSIDGTAITIFGGDGKISHSKFTDNTIGVKIEELDGDLLISDSEFIGNNWGLYLFKTSGHYVNITDCSFSDNSPAPIWSGAANAYLLDTAIDPDRVAVTQGDQFVIISYTLEVFLLDEEENRVPFDITVDMGHGTTFKSFPDQNGLFRKELEVYKVTYDGVQNKGVNIYLEIEYIEGRQDSKDITGTVTDTFDLDTRTSVTYYGFQAPSRTQNFPGNLEAIEDLGFTKGPIYVEPWFDDLGDDKGNLTFSTASSVGQMMPEIDGSMLTLSLQKDWNGVANITVTATDPHGKSLTLIVSINVIPKNDQPVVTDQRIIVKNKNTTTPRTGDTLKAKWEWYDIDGDAEPKTHIIKWFLNGEHQRDWDNHVEIPGVFSGQIWNFTIYPWDQKEASYGIPVHSPPVMVGNLPPTLTSVSITTKNPTTMTDLIAEPRGGNDTETGAVIYNYLWEKRVSSSWSPLGAPNSPILDHRFTEKNKDIRVSCWVSDGISISGIRTATVAIKNSQPYVTSANLNPAVVDETTEMIYLTNIEWGDPDGDIVTLSYKWMVDGIDISISETYPQLMKTDAGWEYPANITVGVTPYDSDYLMGNTYFITVYIQPRDTDGDGLFDDANDNGRNEPGDDKDDDNDGYQDSWEEFLGTDPKNYLSIPTDTDGDGQPDGDSSNSEDWMDLDDDNDGVWDIHPENTDMNNPKWFDTYPYTPNLPGDMDYDGIGDDQDPDIDGDGIANEDDDYPRDPDRHTETVYKENILFQIFTMILLLLIIITIGLGGYLVYNGTIKLPTQAPPSMGGAEAIYEGDDGKPQRANLPPRESEAEVEELEEVDNMRICSSCGDLVTLGDEICPNCGATFELEEEEDELSFDDEEE